MVLSVPCSGGAFVGGRACGRSRGFLGARDGTCGLGSEDLGNVLNHEALKAVRFWLVMMHMLSTEVLIVFETYIQIHICTHMFCFFESGAN